jgi:hypothetical protein
LHAEFSYTGDRVGFGSEEVVDGFRFGGYFPSIFAIGEIEHDAAHL